MKGIDGGYKLSELLSGRGGSADAVVNVATVGAVVLTENWCSIKPTKRFGVTGSHGYAISFECKYWFGLME